MKTRKLKGYAIHQRDGGWAVTPPDSGSALPGLSATFEEARRRALADASDQGDD